MSTIRVERPGLEPFVVRLSPSMLYCLRAFKRMEDDDQRGITWGVLSTNTVLALVRRGLVAPNVVLGEHCLTPQGRAVLAHYERETPP